jgi:hypothetical protein
MNVDICEIVPGGLLPSDHVHAHTNDGTCSRCRRVCNDIDDDVPLMLWFGDGELMMIFCWACLQENGGEP